MPNIPFQQYSYARTDIHAMLGKCSIYSNRLSTNKTLQIGSGLPRQAISVYEPERSLLKDKCQRRLGLCNRDLLGLSGREQDSDSAGALPGEFG